MNYTMIYPDKSPDRFQTQLMTRRNLLKNLALILPVISFSPYAWGSELHESAGESPLVSEEIETMNAFILAVLPGSDRYCEMLVAELSDEFYGFSKYLRFLVKRLDEAAMTKYGRSFAGLHDTAKESIILEGTSVGLIKKQVFNGAIYLLQLIVFAGLCEEDQSCQIINYPGSNRGAFTTYPDFRSISITSITSTGNPK